MLVRLKNSIQSKNQKYIGQVAQVNRIDVWSADNRLCYEITTADKKRHVWAVKNLVKIKDTNLFIMLPKQQRNRRYNGGSF